MKIFISLLLFVLSCQGVDATETDSVLKVLFNEINNSQQYINQRKQHIHELKLAMKYGSHDAKTLLDAYDSLYHSYYDFQYDSAMVYTLRGIKLARRTHNKHYEVLNLMHRALLLALSGFYTDGKQSLDAAYKIGIPESLQFEYWKTKYLFTSFWNDYYRESEFNDKLKADMLESSLKAMRLTQKNTRDYLFLQAMFCQFSGKIDIAIKLWKEAVSKFKYGEPLYAQAACNLALCYQANKQDDLYERWLAEAAIGDIKCATRQTTAMERLAVYIYGKPEQNLKQAELLINFSLEDAKAYNSRLRMMAVNRAWPTIIGTYQTVLKDNNHILKIALFFLSTLLIGGVFLIYITIKQNKRLSYSRRRLRVSYQHLDKLNAEVREKNNQLLDMNTKREALVRVYIDLCDKYIERFKNFKKLVVRKIKGGQGKDLLGRISNSELSQEESVSFLNNFDKAFLQLYPTFVAELNTLLRDECQIPIPQSFQLSTEIRIAALIRLGVKDSSEMANLLFYSPQTTYNYRWSLRKKAKNKDSFEEAIAHLCRYQ